MDPIYGTGYLTGQSEDSSLGQAITYLSPTGNITSAMTQNFQGWAGDDRYSDWNWGIQNTNLGKWGMGKEGDSKWVEYYKKLDDSKAAAAAKLDALTKPAATPSDFYGSGTAATTPSDFYGTTPKLPATDNTNFLGNKKRPTTDDEDSSSILTGA